MGALPKRKISKGRQGRRRQHDTLDSVQLVPCENCGELKVPHRVCASCGTYKGREVVAVRAN
ncbi:MAG: 50S ribosomal protein L32 [Anaerolineae bacterium]|nr:50S ribosomal protein L32 [Anaerolineae bacterium]